MENGNLAGFSELEIATECEWEGDPVHFVEQLKRCGLLDGDGMVHDWEEYMGEYLDTRNQNRERQKRHREKIKKEKAGNVTISDSNVTSPVTRRNSNGHSTVPTVHNQPTIETDLFLVELGKLTFCTMQWAAPSEGNGKGIATKARIESLIEKAGIEKVLKPLVAEYHKRATIYVSSLMLAAEKYEKANRPNPLAH